MYQLIYTTDTQKYKVIKKRRRLSKNFKKIVNSRDNIFSICESLNAGVPKIIISYIDKNKLIGAILNKNKNDESCTGKTTKIVENNTILTKNINDLSSLEKKNVTDLNIDGQYNEVLKSSYISPVHKVLDIVGTKKDDLLCISHDISKVSHLPPKLNIDMYSEQVKQDVKTGQNSINDVKSNSHDRLEDYEIMQGASHCPIQTDEDSMMAENELKNSNFHSTPYQDHQDMIINDNDLNFTDDSINFMALSQDQKELPATTHSSRNVIISNTTISEPSVDLEINLNFRQRNQNMKINCSSTNLDISTDATQNIENNFDKIFQKECDIQAQGIVSSPGFNSPEDDLLESVIIPSMDEIIVDDSDLSNYESNYKISEQLECILSSQLDSETVEFVRAEHETVNENLSVPDLGHEEINSYSILSDHNSISKETSDIDFDPAQVIHSSTITEDSAHSLQLPKIGNDGDPTFENTPMNVPSFVSSTKKIVVKNSTSIKVPLSMKGSCDNSKLNVESSFTTDEVGNVTFQPRWKKKYFCIYCQKSVVKLPRHIDTKHKDIEEAQQLKSTPKGTKERKKLLEILRDNGRYMHNTNPDYNTGKLLVSRRPRSEKKVASDYTTCAKCLKTVTKANSYKHFATCINHQTKGSNSYKFLGRYVE
ncbi:uncharacterized protein LOC141532218 [Cotesia typhae]|uniref:uncharacterized protein LOC141532218 n=1 Tax=Cotesia typhae TaxID=2053667 RepID=UPI003D69FC62